MIVTMTLGGTMFLLAAYFWWGFRMLPGEKWQIFAALPTVKTEEGGWRGVNFTWYGILIANANLVAVAKPVLLLRRREGLGWESRWT